MAGASLLGVLGAVLLGRAHPEAFAFAPPTLTAILPAWNPSTFLTISLPLAVLAIGAGSVQGLGLLMSQGYAPPVKLVTGIVGANTIVNALFGGHASTIQRAGTAIVAGEEAGPVGSRYVANLVASVGALLLAACSATAGTLLGVLPAARIAALAGLAILTTLIDAIRRSTASQLPLGGFFAFAIAASPLTILGIGSTFWALVGGMVVSALTERKAFQQQIAGTTQATPSRNEGGQQKSGA